MNIMPSSSRAVLGVATLVARRANAVTDWRTSRAGERANGPGGVHSLGAVLAAHGGVLIDLMPIPGESARVPWS
jgi:hypothetical protein